MKKLLLAAAAAGALFGCTGASLEGEWVQPVPALPGQVQGMRLEAGGNASSVNMQTLLYTHWSRHGGNLVLEGKSVGNGQTLVFSESYRIEKLTREKLVLVASAGEKLEFTRRK